MTDLLKETKLFYSKITKKEETYKRRAIRPAQDWLALLVISSVIFCLLILFASYFYLQIRDDKLFTINKDAMLKEVKFNTSLLQKTINDINTREELTNNLKNNGLVPPDPSI